MSRHIGIVGCSAEGAALCYRTVCLEAESLMGRHGHPEVTMHTICLAEYMKPLEDGRGWPAIAELMLQSAETLKRAGADFAISPDNTIHQALPLVLPRSPLPWLHIAEEVAKEARQRGFKKLGLTGTRFLVNSEVYPEELSKLGIGFARPSHADREAMNSIIFDELVRGQLTVKGLRCFQSVIDRLKADGCDAVVLGCTEIPLLISDKVSSLPTLDSTRILARAAIRYALPD